jgi:secreted Zn-dependent insulinase-like peptidase
MEAVPCEISANFELLVIVISLTENGLEYYEEVVKVIFQYAEMLRRVGPQESIYKEVIIYNFIYYI